MAAHAASLITSHKLRPFGGGRIAELQPWSVQIVERFVGLLNNGVPGPDHGGLPAPPRTTLRGRQRPANHRYVARRQHGRRCEKRALP